jgi:S1-C subfamily serine protease
MDEETNGSRSQLWRGRLRRLFGFLRRGLPFALGVVAAFAALILYHLLFPGPQPLTTRQVNDVVAHTMGSATPPPAFSSRVYQVIQPSLVLIQTQGKDAANKTEYGLGSGVVIDDSGDILTSLHVVANTSDIRVTFADGTESGAQVTGKQADHDIAVVRATHPPAQLVPAVLGNPGAMNIGDEAYVVGNPFGLYSSMSAGVISGFNRTFQPMNTNTH